MTGLEKSVCRWVEGRGSTCMRMAVHEWEHLIFGSGLHVHVFVSVADLCYILLF